MARLSSHKIVLRMKFRTTESLSEGTRETVEHIAVTDKRQILCRTTVIVHSPKGTRRTYGRWLHWSRLSNRVSVEEFQSRHTMEGWVTVPTDSHATNQQA